MPTYIYQKKNWPEFTWDADELSHKLAKVRHQQGRLLGSMEALGFRSQREAFMEILAEDVLKTSEIEGEFLNADQVRSSIARHLGVAISHSVPSGRDIDGIVEMHLDAAQHNAEPLTKERLFQWHALLFPEPGRHNLTIGQWRTAAKGPMQVVSGSIGKEKVHFEAPEAGTVEREMKRFLKWFNAPTELDPVLKAAIAHFWFVTVHPFEDGNGRIARAIADMQLARADGSVQRFYSMSARIQKDWREYYRILGETQKGGLDITPLLYWFLECLGRALENAAEMMARIKQKAKFWDGAGQANLNVRQKLMLNKMLDGFDGKLTTAKWAKIAKCSHDTALRDIQGLIEQNILHKEEGGGRSSSYSITSPPAPLHGVERGD